MRVDRMSRARVLAEPETRYASDRWALPRNVQRRSAMPGVPTSEYAGPAALNLGCGPYRRDSSPCTSRGTCEARKSPSLSNTKFGLAGVPRSGIVRTVDTEWGDGRGIRRPFRSDAVHTCRPADTRTGEPLVHLPVSVAVAGPGTLAGGRRHSRALDKLNASAIAALNAWITATRLTDPGDRHLHHLSPQSSPQN